MGTIRFERGKFQAFRAIVGFHLGSFAQSLSEGDEVLFDGTTLRIGPEDRAYPQLAKAISLGWLVPADQEGGSYVPQPAGIELRPAEARGRERGPAMRVGVVADEERDVGRRKEVRLEAQKPVGERKIRTASNSARVAPQKTYEVIQEGGTEGRVVGRGSFSVRAGLKQDAVDISKGEDTQFKRAIEHRNIQQLVHAHDAGDEEAEGEEIFPEGEEEPGETPEEKEARLKKAKMEAAAKRAARLKDAKQAEEAAKNEEFGAGAVVGGTGEPIQGFEATSSTVEREIDASAKITRGSSSIGGAEDGVVVSRVGARAKATPARVDVATALSELETSSDEMVISFDDPEPGQDAAPDAETAPDASDADAEPALAPAEPEPESVPPAAIIQAKIEMIRQFVPGFEWDMSEHWKTRVKKALEYKSNLPVLNAILSLEVDSVRKHVMQGLYG